MARLPVYTNRANLDTGSDTFRLSPDTGAAIGQGLTKLGSGLEDLGVNLLRTSAHDSAKLEAIAKRDASFRDEVEFIRLKDRIQQYALEQQDKVGDDADGYTRSVEKFAVDEYSNLLSSGRLSAEGKAKHDLMFERLRDGVVDQASRYEAGTKQKFRSEVYESRIKDATAFVSATGVAGLDQATKEWSDFIDRTGGKDTRLGKRVYELGIKRIHEQATRAEAFRRPLEFQSKFQGIFSETPSATTGNPLVDATLKYAPAHGLDPKWMTAIGWLESKLNASHDGPRLRPGDPRALGRKGATHMSSAEGGWQMLDSVARELGLSIADKKDPDKSTEGAMRWFARYKSVIEHAGYQVTPGKLYMTYNVGPGVAKAILKASPNARIEDVIYSAYPSRPAEAAQVLRNNPSMYKAGMTVGQVLNNYEAQVARAMKATEKFFSGNVATDEQTGAIVSAFMGRDMPGVGTAELVSIFADVSRHVKDVSAKERDISAGNAHLLNPGSGDPYDTQRKKEINAAVEARYGDSLVQGISTGDNEAFKAARQVTDAAGFMPDKVLHGYRAALDAGATGPAMLALQSLAFLSRDNAQAYNASALHADEKDAVHSYRAFTETLGFDPATATRQVLFYRTPEGKKQRQALSDKTRAEWRNGGTEQDAEDKAWSEIRAGFDQNGVWPGAPDTVTDVQREALVEAYRMGIVHNRLEGYPLAEAKARALKTLSNIWGVSNVADSERGQSLMPLPPEKVLAGKAIGGSFGWVREQASNLLDNYLIRTGRRKPIERTDEFGNVHVDPATRTDFKLVPKPGSVADFINGRPVAYEIWFRDDDSTIHKAVGVEFVPDYTDAKAKDDEDFRRRRKPTKSKAEQTPATGIESVVVVP